MISDTELRVRSYPPQTRMQPHLHEEASISIVVRGAFIESIGRRERDYARGHIAYLPPAVVHSQTFGRAGARQIIFKPQPAWLDYLADCRLRLDESPHGRSPLFCALGERLLQEIITEDGFSALASEGIILEIIAAFARSSSAAVTGAKPPTWLRAARDFLHETAPAPPSMRRLAQVACRHEIHLAREFRRFFGTSVGLYARRLRSEHAAKLLRRPYLSISDVALECGFSSHSHLCREFRLHFGLTPSQFRRGMQ